MIPAFVDPEDADGPQGPRVVWGLGGNLGDVRATFRWAIRQLERELGAVQVGGLYRTEPISKIAQSDFFNTAVAGRLPSSWLENPLADTVRRLVGLAKRLEKEAGRLHDSRDGGLRDAPRALDIDLLLLGEHPIELPSLKSRSTGGPSDLWPGPILVPHPRLAERRFVLLPLFDLFGDESLPGPRAEGESIVSALDRLGTAQRADAIPW